MSGRKQRDDRARRRARDMHDAGLRVTSPEARDVGLRSGADARAHGRVDEYADLMYRRLLAQGQSIEQAERARAQIVERFGGDGDGR